MPSKQAMPQGLVRKICQGIKDQIAAGLLGAGAELPSTRSLAVEWGISRTSATLAYEQLAAEGYLEIHQGTRARIAQGVTLRQPLPTPTIPIKPPRPLSAFAQRLANLPIPAAFTDHRPVLADFRYGDLAAADFPTLTWRKAISAALLKQPSRLSYGDPQGLPALRIALQGYLWRARGLRCEADHIVIVNGSQQGLDLCARLLLDPGNLVVMENPGYYLAQQAFSATGAATVPVAVDQDGLQTTSLPDARLAFVTPSHQFPLGGVLPAGRRRELLAWAQRVSAYVIEDDYDGEYRFDINPIPSLQALDEDGRVIYLGTVSKTLSPDLRLGYLVVPAALSEVFARAKRLTDRHTPVMEQEALADLIECGAYERHIRRVRRRHGARRAALLAALGTTLGEAVTVVGADAGLHVVVWLNNVAAAEEDAVVARARELGLGIYPITSAYAAVPAPNRPAMAGLVMGYAGLDEHLIKQGVSLLKAALDTYI